MLIDHAFLEKKAANNAMELLTRWPKDWTEGRVETMAAVARDETAQLAQVLRLLLGRGGRLDRSHKNSYANSLRLLVRKGEPAEVLDRLLRPLAAAPPFQPGPGCTWFALPRARLSAPPGFTSILKGCPACSTW
ncbi:MAG: hypothetical protein LAQ69_29690 [Acidobacteriia bacterium]|nr:hypothetical protein [Terriglobia bacterium]